MINKKGMFYGSLVENAIMREGSLATVNSYMAESEEAEGKRIPATREQDQGGSASGKEKGRAYSGNRSECAYAKQR